MAIKLFRVLVYLTAGTILICVLAYFGGYLALDAVGSYLIVEAPLKPALAIVVLSGARSPYRALEGARLYHSGWAPKVVLTQPRNTGFDDFESLGIHVVSVQELNHEVLVRGKVPEDAIMMIGRKVENTLTELETVLDVLSPPAGSTLIIVTSNYHTRRTAKIWDYLTGGQTEGLIRFARDDPRFDADRWWENRGSIKLLVVEYLGLLNYWLGFPWGVGIPSGAFYQLAPA